MKIKMRKEINKGCGKFKCSVSIVGGWCGITKHLFGKDKHYCSKCIKKFVEQYKKSKSSQKNSNTK